MITFISKYKSAYLWTLALLLTANSSFLTSCSDMLDTSSEMVEFSENNTLSTPQDSLYSVMGVISKLQTIADRTVVLGELRGDLVVPTNAASTALKQVANFNVSASVANKYNNISDYYAVINNCNYFIAHADTALSKLGKKIFDKEFAAMKTYRAWTYLQLAKVYGSVPLVTEPILTENEAQKALEGKYYGMQEICNYFIDDIKPYVDTNLPQYGSIGPLNDCKYFFIPVRVLLGEMCLWAGRYQEAAEYFYGYLNKKNNPIVTNTQKAKWNVTNLDFSSASITRFTFTNSTSEYISIIPMESSDFYGTKSDLINIFSSTDNNYYYYQVEPSPYLYSLSYLQNYVYLSSTSDTQKDTVYVPKTGLKESGLSGDLRWGNFAIEKTVNQDETSQYSSLQHNITKYSSSANYVGLYRRQQVYLMFAEALCRAGYPESAFCILKYGLRKQNIDKYVSQKEQERAASLLGFSDDDFTQYNTQGIHARGCGDVDCDTTYCLPMPSQALASYQDTIDYQIPLLEDMIVDEMALEEAYEGYRYYDLMRIALRRNNPSYLALPISWRTGKQDDALYNLLMDTKNWYLPIK